MNNQTPDDPFDLWGNEEERYEALVELTLSLTAALRDGNDRSDTWEEVAQISDRLGMTLKKRKEQWPAKNQKVWDQLLDACSRLEEESLRGKGFSIEKARKLIRREWAIWDSDSCRIVTVKKRPSQDSAVPVVVVQREAGFRIHDDVLPHLRFHPLLADEIAASERRDSRSVFTGTLERVEFIAEEHHLDDWDYIAQVADQDSPVRAAARCLLTALDVKTFLESESSRDMEDLTWLTEAKRGMHLWG